MEEARTSPRTPVDFPVSFVSEESSGHGSVYNISVGGCAIRTDVHVPRDSYVQLDLHVPDGQQPLKVPFAGVRWATREEFGVQFLQIGHAEKVRLQRFLATASASS